MICFVLVTCDEALNMSVRIDRCVRLLFSRFKRYLELSRKANSERVFRKKIRDLLTNKRLQGKDQLSSRGTSF